MCKENEERHTSARSTKIIVFLCAITCIICSCDYTDIYSVPMHGMYIAICFVWLYLDKLSKRLNSPNGSELYLAGVSLAATLSDNPFIAWIALGVLSFISIYTVWKDRNFK